MQIRRSMLIGVLGAALVGSAMEISRTSGQDAPPTSRPATRPTGDIVTMMLHGTGRRLENLKGMTDDQKQQIDDLMADTAKKLDDILTDDQKAELQDRMEQMMNNMRNGGGGGGGGAGFRSRNGGGNGNANGGANRNGGAANNGGGAPGQ